MTFREIFCSVKQNNSFLDSDFMVEDLKKLTDQSQLLEENLQNQQNLLACGVCLLWVWVELQPFQ